MSKKTIKIIGMHCISCAKNIEEVLSELQGVQESSVDFALGKANVVFDQKKISLEKILSAIKDAGYTPSA